MIEFPFKKLLKRFNAEDYDNDRSRTEKAAWDYGKKAREGLITTGLVEFFGIVVGAAKGIRNAWDVTLESWDHITGIINVGEKLKDKRDQDVRYRRRSDDDK